MDERTRQGLNFFLTATVVLAGLALFSTMMLPSWLHGNPLYIVAVVVTALGITYALDRRDIVEEWGLEPLPPRPEEHTTAGARRGEHKESEAVEGKTPKERVENRQSE